jgi:hypothetical protein
VGWVAVGVWIGAVLLAMIVLTFCGYELHWKSVRLRTDLERLTNLSAELTSLQADVVAARERAGDTSG